jgi:hypothetical protein
MTSPNKNKYLVRSGGYVKEISAYNNAQAAETYVEGCVSDNPELVKDLPLTVYVTLGEDTEVFRVTGDYSFNAYAYNLEDEDD